MITRITESFVKFDDGRIGFPDLQLCFSELHAVCFPGGLSRKPISSRTKFTPVSVNLTYLLLESKPGGDYGHPFSCW